MGVAPPGAFEPMVGDPDDHRPASTWHLVTDPGGPGDARVSSLAFLWEKCAPGDQIPLHRHEVDEAVIVLEGRVEYWLGDETLTVEAGSTVFIPAGTQHGMRNVGSEAAHITAVFPTTMLDIEMLDRNPAPGTEDSAPMRSRVDARSGEVEVLGESRLDR